MSLYEFIIIKIKYSGQSALGSVEVKDALWGTLANVPFMLKKYELNINFNLMTVKQMDMFWVWWLKFIFVTDFNFTDQLDIF